MDGECVDEGIAECVAIYMTTDSKESATKIATELVSKRLVSCVNIFDNVTSMFHWKGDVKVEQECSLIAKSRKSLVKDVARAVKRVHPYEMPCVIALPIAMGNPDFMRWITEETKDAITE